MEDRGTCRLTPGALERRLITIDKGPMQLHSNIHDDSIFQRCNLSKRFLVGPRRVQRAGGQKTELCKGQTPDLGIGFLPGPSWY